MYSSFSLDFDDASTIAAACLASTQQLRAMVSVAVVDSAGHLLHFSRMDGARGFSVELAMKKARLAASVGVSTATIAAIKGAAAAQATAGGLPVLLDGQCVGAIGISGASAQVDETIAAAGISAFGSRRT
ncbi:heme-binding protein [Sphingomonas oligophenolica]|uniref:Heme-binding protein n=1 Tax=Sphingomonas oligophenolica TaxID=301154 RepID=A0ABU9Y1K6_9SPHN